MLKLFTCTAVVENIPVLLSISPPHLLYLAGIHGKNPISSFVWVSKIFRRYLCFAGIGIQNARLFLRVQNEKQRNQVKKTEQPRKSV